MHGSVERLLSVQDVDSQLLFLKEAIRRRPLEVEDELRKHRECKAEVDRILSRIRDARKAVDGFELEIQGFDAEIEKLGVAQNQAKSNAEYMIFREQIARQKGRRSDAEEQALTRLSDIDDLARGEKEARDKLQAAEKALERKQKEIAEVVAGMNEQVGTLEKERAGLVGGIEKDHLGIYEKVLGRYRSLAIARVEGGTCHGCHMAVTPQDVSLLMQSEFLQCKSCSRILYMD
jgi:hypothetical protein